MRSKGTPKQGFTLVELLVVIVIIGLIAALLLPAIMKAMCSARQGAAQSLISQVAQAATMYNTDFAVYPPGKGDGSKELTYALTTKGAKKMQYFEFAPDQLFNGHIINPVWGSDGEPPTNLIYYRNNQTTILSSGTPAPSGIKPGPTKPGPAKPIAATPKPAGPAAALIGPPVLKKSSFDMWCAGCDYLPTVQATQWGVRYE
jgi:prepilin-type N-terminal cleavage/methylation domain-containing protein